MNLDYRDYAVRALILIAGAVAALLLSMKGYGTAVPAIALGGAIGAACASTLQSAE